MQNCRAVIITLSIMLSLSVVFFSSPSHAEIRRVFASCLLNANSNIPAVIQVSAFVEYDVNRSTNRVRVLSTKLDTQALPQGGIVYGTIAQRSRFAAQIGSEKFLRREGTMASTRTTFAGTRNSYPADTEMAIEARIFIAGWGIRDCRRQLHVDLIVPPF